MFKSDRNGLRFTPAKRQFNGKCTTSAQRTFHTDAATHQLCKPLDNGKAQAGTAVFTGDIRIFLFKGFKNLIKLFFRNPAARIGYHKTQLHLVQSGWSLGYIQPDGAAVWGKFQRIGQEV